MARASNAEKAGLDVHLTQMRDGRWSIRLIDDQGNIVFDREYATEWTARDKARRWVRDNYNVDTEEAPIEPPPKVPRKQGRPRSLGPAPSHLGALMRARADDNEEKAVALRIQADHLEAEAKRLRVAADALEGPDGQD
jgi:hypothetical protein